MLTPAWGGNRADAGVALVGTLVGFLIFLLLLLFAAEAMIRMYATSALTSAATRAAETVAQSPVPSASVVSAEAEARAQLGSFGATRTTFSWTEVDSNQVVVQVTGYPPGVVRFLPGSGRITRTVTVRTERFRP